MNKTLMTNHTQFRLSTTWTTSAWRERVVRSLFKILFTAVITWAVLLVLSPQAEAAQGLKPLQGNVQKSGALEQTPEPLNGQVEKTPQGKGIVGLDLAIRPDKYPLVRDVFKFSPAYLAGIRPGDTVVAVDGRSVKGLSSWTVDQAISDIPGVSVQLTVKRDGTLWNVPIEVASINNAHPMLQAMFVGTPIMDF